MKYAKKLTALLAALTMLLGVGGGVLPETAAQDIPMLTASAEGEEEAEYIEGTYELLTYRNYGDYIAITGCDGSAVDVVIPDKINGVPVTVVGGFGDLWEDSYIHKSLTSVTIPDSVTTIADFAFTECINLKTINIGKGVTKVGTLAFHYTPWMENQLDETGFAIANGILLDAACPGIAYIPEGVTRLEDFSLSSYWLDLPTYFRSCPAKIVVVPEGVTSIGEFVSPDIIYLPTTIQSINMTNGTSPGGEIYFAGTAEQWDAIDFYNEYGDEYAEESRIPSDSEWVHLNATLPEAGTSGPYTYLVNGDAAEIIACDASVIMADIPAEVDGLPVKSIGDHAFAACSDLTSVRIPEGVTSIGDEVFNSSNVLVSISIPKSVETIGYDAFSWCTVQQDVWYSGSKKAWDAIDNSSTYTLSDAKMHFAPDQAQTELFGDVDDSGTVDAADAAQILVISAEAGAGNTSLLTDAADIDGNGEVDAADAAVVLSYAAEVGAGAGITLEEFVGKQSSDYVEDETYEESELDVLLNTAELNPQQSVTVYDWINAEGKEKVDHTFKLREADIETIERFAEEHFPENATMAQKLYITHQWIHFHPDYAYDYDKVIPLTYVDAIFNYELGQCLQYNGAMAAVLAYYGYDVYMYHVEGHFSTNVTINGEDYHVECGNYGKNGSWQSFFS